MRDESWDDPEAVDAVARGILNCFLLAHERSKGRKRVEDWRRGQQNSAKSRSDNAAEWHKEAHRRDVELILEGKSVATERARIITEEICATREPEEWFMASTTYGQITKTEHKRDYQEVRAEAEKAWTARNRPKLRLLPSL